MNTKFNELPTHLKQFLVDQDYSLYTSIDQASWRYIMRVSQAFFKDHAHPIYLNGLKRAGISTERIPRISEMDEKLKQFGWRAVSITGFIPPEVFLEMLSLQILPIACDMRQIEHIEYTPAPDIVHEAAGHAPILADPSYSSFLRKFGEIARWVIFAKEDTEVYKATLALSEIKEDPHSTENDVAEAQKTLDAAYAKVTYVSEAQFLTRLGWWTTEYGLFKKGNEYLIYGAGLLSSAGESYNCLSEKVKKIPLDIHCTEMDYDITRPQLQLYYTDDFKKLEATIDELASRMSYKIGGHKSLERARVAQTVTTSVTETGLQISGVLKNYVLNSQEEICLLEFENPCQLATSGSQIEIHRHPVKYIMGQFNGASALKVGQSVQFHLSSGMEVNGLLTELKMKDGKILYGLFKDYKVHLNGKDFSSVDDLLVVPFATQIVSVFGGAADRGSYLAEVGTDFTKPRSPKSNASERNKNLLPLYGEVRKLREGGPLNPEGMARLEKIADALDKDYPHDWLLRLEILELVGNIEALEGVAQRLNGHLKNIMSKDSSRKDLIKRGVAIIDRKLSP